MIPRVQTEGPAAEVPSFWRPLRRTQIAAQLKIGPPSPTEVFRYDRAFFSLSPWLEQMVKSLLLEGKRVLEIDVGAGSLGQEIVSWGADYHAVDASQDAVELMDYRLALVDLQDQGRVQCFSWPEIPHADSSFDFVFWVRAGQYRGKLHDAIGEIHRVLAPGGVAVVELYRRDPFQPAAAARIRLSEGLEPTAAERPDGPDQAAASEALEPSGAAGVPPLWRARWLFRDFARVEVRLPDQREVTLSGEAITRQHMGRLESLRAQVFPRALSVRAVK